MAPGKGGAPTGAIADKIAAKWGSFDTFKEEFSKSAATNFGSGWTWLVESNGELEIFNTSNNEGGFWDDGWMPMVAGNDETYKEQCSRSAYIFYKAWLMRLNHTQETVRFYSNILLLQNFLKQNNIKYLFWNACSNLPENNPAFYNETDLSRFPFITQKEYSYTNVLVSKQFEHSEFAKYGHYGEDAQEWFANFLKSYITKNNLL